MTRTSQNFKISMNEKRVIGKLIFGCNPLRTETGVLVERTTWKTPGTANSLKQAESENILFSDLQETLEPGVE